MQSMEEGPVQQVESSPRAVSVRSVGIPKRHEHMLGSTVPSTIRLVTTHTGIVHGVEQSSPSTKVAGATTHHGLKPFCRYPIKNSPSMRCKNPEQHVRPSSTFVHQANDSSEIATPSETAQAFSTRSRTTTSYPDLPSDTEEEPDLPIPGAFPTPTSSRRRQQHQQQQQQQQDRPTPEPFIFGTTSGMTGISNEQFGMAGDAVLEEMNRKLRERGVVPIGEEMNRDEVLRVKGRHVLGGGHGLAMSGQKKTRGRFDDVHARQFAKWVPVACCTLGLAMIGPADACFLVCGE